MAYKRKALHPSFGIARLRKSRGARFRELVDYVAGCSTLDPAAMAFTLMIRRLHHPSPGCPSQCHDPSCALCATTVVSQYPGNDDSLLDVYYQAYREVEVCLGAGREKISVA